MRRLPEAPKALSDPSPGPPSDGSKQGRAADAVAHRGLAPQRSIPKAPVHPKASVLYAFASVWSRCEARESGFNYGTSPLLPYCQAKRGCQTPHRDACPNMDLHLSHEVLLYDATVAKEDCNMPRRLCCTSGRLQKHCPQWREATTTGPPEWGLWNS